MKGGIDLLSEILTTASQVKLLVTSRERLNIQRKRINTNLTEPQTGIPQAMR